MELKPGREGREDLKVVRDEGVGSMDWELGSGERWLKMVLREESWKIR
jgi:hypothetical protein